MTPPKFSCLESDLVAAGSVRVWANKRHPVGIFSLEDNSCRCNERVIIGKANSTGNDISPSLALKCPVLILAATNSSATLEAYITGRVLIDEFIPLPAC